MTFVSFKFPELIESGKKAGNVVISIADGYVVRFSVLESTNPGQFINRIHEQFIVHDIARNQLVAVTASDDD